MMKACVIAAVLGYYFISVQAEAVTAQQEQQTCEQAIMAIERGATLPTDLLKAIALVESGRADPVTGRISPWPWTINVGGTGYFYASKAEAIDAVRVFRALGSDSIDVGCMQINLRYHPAAFASLDEALDPARNVAYGVQFLRALVRQTGNWPQAIGAYHSQTPELGAAYWTRVAAQWPLARRFALNAPTLTQPEAAPADPNRTLVFSARLREMEEDHRRNLERAGVITSRNLASAGARDPAQGEATNTAWRRLAGLFVKTTAHIP